MTGFPEMLDGRVKTLHPKVHAGLLARRDLPAHMAQLKEAGIQPIDMVVVNLYPFKATIQQPDVTQAEAIEQIDIGGPSMLRSAAKNFAAVLPIVDPADYEQILADLQTDAVTPSLRQRLAAKVFQHTAAYDALIAQYLTTEEFPEKLTLTYDKKQALRYGENSHQRLPFTKMPYRRTSRLRVPSKFMGKSFLTITSRMRMPPCGWSVNINSRP